MNDRLTTFLREVLFPYLARNQNDWDLAGEFGVINEETVRRRGTAAFRMRQRLQAVMAGVVEAVRDELFYDQKDVALRSEVEEESDTELGVAIFVGDGTTPYHHVRVLVFDPNGKL